MAGKQVLLLHTGGTLGMAGTPLEPGAYEALLLDQVPELQKIADIDTRIICNLDSSDMGPHQWVRLARAIADAHDDYDGFVVVHGTDTMAYTASALAFALEGLQRPVVLTGAQRPLAALRTDARRNLQDAVEIATCDIPEVGICFDGMFLRGCRSVKNDARSYRAFDSPGVGPLASLGFDVDIRPHVRRVPGPLLVDTRFDPRVAIIQVTPGLSADLIRRMLDGTDVAGVVLAAFGIGTVPSRDRPLAPAIGEAVSRGIDVVVCTQWGGIVDLDVYKNSRGLRDAGAISAGAARTEATVVKLMCALGRWPDDRAARRGFLERNVAGELG